MSSENLKLYKSLGSLIKDYRRWRGLSQEIFAKSIRVSVRELRRWETDCRRARIENLHDLSEVTGISMQVFVALNSDQPVWYSLSERRFAYTPVEIEHSSIDEVLKYSQRFDDGDLIRNDRITTDRHIHMILSCHQDIYRSDRSLEGDVIKRASMILPDFNRIFFDSWGHYVGHIVCLPMDRDVYQRLKTQKAFEGYLTTERISDIVALHEGVFFCYSLFAANTSAAHSNIIEITRDYLPLIEKKGKYLVACHAPTREIKENCKKLGMRIALSNKTELEQMDSKIVPALYEMELDVLVRSLKLFGLMGKECGKGTRALNLTRKVKQESLPAISGHQSNKVTGPRKKHFLGRIADYNSLIRVDKHSGGVDNSSFIDEEEQGQKTQRYHLENETCQNLACTLYGKPGKGNIVSNGTYRTKNGNLFRRFLCKECSESFCSRTGTIFHGLRSPEEKILLALTLLVKGMPLHGVAKCIGAEFNTVRHWLEVAAKQSKKIGAMLMKEPDVSQVELEALWTSVKRNSLRQRAILWRKSNTSQSRLPHSLLK